MKNTSIGDSGASCHITNDDNGMYDIIDINEPIQGSSGIIPATKKNKLRRTGPHSMACEVLPYSRGKSVFPNEWTLVGKQDLKQSIQQHCHQYSKWWYHTWSLNQDSWRFGCQSRLSISFHWQKGSVSNSPTQVKHQWFSCWVGPPIERQSWDQLPKALEFKSLVHSIHVKTVH